MNQDAVLDRPEAQLWAVADGMGGHLHGEEAARMLVDAIAAVEHGASGYACLAEIEERVKAANRSLHDAAATSGSTIVALLIHDGHAACLWAGDSRAYRFASGTLTQLTRDHSVVQQLVDRGLLAEDERARHPSAHVITRAVGAAADIDLERRFERIEDGDRLLLCSDGLTSCVADDEIRRVIGTTDLQIAADHLMSLALSRDARDNISFVLIEAESR